VTTAVRDAQRQQVYRAGHGLEWVYNNAVHSLSVEIAGVPLQLEPESKFGDLAAIQAYVDRVQAMPGVIARFGKKFRVTVRERKGAGSAHYKSSVIAIHTGGGDHARWAMRELVVLHELAHHMVPGDKHGPKFATALVDLIDLVMGPQAALAMSLLYQQEGVQTQ
jgi:putative metallohydrolase (TIGR04338 family)